MKHIFTIALLLLLVAAGCVKPTMPTGNNTNDTSPDDGRLAAIECPADHPKGDGPCTLEYNPVCADGVTYGNICGACRYVERYFPGECKNVGNDSPPPTDMKGYVECTGEQRNKPCTKEYNPVCATQDNGVRCITTPCDSTYKRTYGNACSACAEPLVYGYVPGECPTTVTDDKKGTHLIYKDGQWTDINGCPQGYDEFQGQIKKMCVTHYGPAEIQSWPVCQNAATCSTHLCVLANRQTNGQEIAWKGINEYRCVPPDYRDFMLHTSGASGIDENGDKYSVIA